MRLLKPLALGLAITAYCLPSVLPAQTAKEQREAQVWSLQGLDTGYCVLFVIDPRAASKQLKRGFRPVPAGQDGMLHPALRQVIQHQPEFGSWSASRLCFYFSDAVQVGSRRVAEKNPRNQQMLAVWTLAAEDEESRVRRDLAVELFAGRGNLRRAGESAGVRLREAHASVIDSAGSATDVYSMKLERTTVVWRGRSTGDSTRVDHAMEESWSVPGTRLGLWSVHFAFRPLSSRALAGSLTVEGKGDLAKAMKGSPIRFVGPLYRGGTAELRFSR